jgi:hypothetical protein
VGFGARVDPTLGNRPTSRFPTTAADRPPGGARRGRSTTGQPTAVNLGVAGANSAVGLALGSVNGAFNLDVALTALGLGNGRLLSTPGVTTQNNVAAGMTQGVQIQTVANNR